MGLILTVWTVIVLLLFAGVVAWAWHRNNRAYFEDAARIPLDDDDGPDQRGADPHG